MLSVPDRDNMVGSQTIEGMWTAGSGGMKSVLNFAGRSNWLQGKLKYVQCLTEFSVRRNVTRVCQFHPTFQKDANQVD